MPLGRLTYNKDGRWIDVWAQTPFELEEARKALLIGMKCQTPDWRFLPSDWQLKGAGPQPPTEIAQLSFWERNGMMLWLIIVGILLLALGWGAVFRIVC